MALLSAHPRCNHNPTLLTRVRSTYESRIMSTNNPPLDPSSSARAGGKRPARTVAERPVVRRRDPCPALLTVDMTAERFVVSPRHVRRLIARGELPVHRIGNAIRISEDDIAHYLASTRQR